MGISADDGHGGRVVNWPRRIASVLLFPALIAIGCSDESGPGPGGNEPDSLVAFRLSIRHDPTGTEDFIAATSDSAVIETARAQLALPAGERTLHIHGPIAKGDGGHNLTWGWHFTPGQWDLVQLSMELCDGNPSAVEAQIDYWVDTIGVFCPWNSYIEEEAP